MTVIAPRVGTCHTPSTRHDGTHLLGMTCRSATPHRETFTLTTGQTITGQRPLAGDVVTLDGITFDVMEARGGYSPAGLPNLSLTLVRTVGGSPRITTATFYRAHVNV